MNDRLRRLAQHLYAKRYIGYATRLLVGILTLPRKIAVLEEQRRRTDALEQHMPAVLNYISSFGHSSRQMTRRMEELGGAITDVREQQKSDRESISAILGPPRFVDNSARHLLPY
jgi:hypothetical protein